MKNLKSKKGFSLVELLVVITIIAILSVVAYTAVGGNTVKARDSKRIQDLSTIQSALELYFVEFSAYPNSPLTIGANTGSPNTNLIPRKYLSTIPQDPKQPVTDYYYNVVGQGYVLGAVLENDGIVGNYKSYVVGNLDSGFVNDGNDNPAGSGSACQVEPDVENCYPYTLP